MDEAAKALFLASLPTGDKGKPIPGHTTWDQLGPKAQERCRRMAAAVEGVLKNPHHAGNNS